MRTSLGSVLAVVLFAAVAACSSEPSDATDVSEAAVTTTGLAHEGASCRSAPVYRAEKCAEGLVCNQAPQAANGVCVRPGSEGDPCDASFASTNCQHGLVCTPKGPGQLGYCKGAGVGRCLVSNGNSACAGGRICVAQSAQSNEGTCTAAGASGTPCHTDLVQNECDETTSCVGTGNANLGVCRPNNPMDWTSCPSDGTNPPVHAGALFGAVGGDLGPVTWATQSRFCTKQKDGSLVCPPWAGSIGESGRAALHPTLALQGSDLDFIGVDQKVTVSCLDAKGGTPDWGCYSPKAPNDSTTSYSLVVTGQCLVLRTSMQQNVSWNDSRHPTKYGSVLQVETGALARY